MNCWSQANAHGRSNFGSSTISSDRLVNTQPIFWNSFPQKIVLQRLLIVLSFTSSIVFIVQETEGTVTYSDTTNVDREIKKIKNSQFQRKGHAEHESEVLDD